MSERKWTQIVVYFDNTPQVSIQRTDFDKMEEITPVLEALLSVKRMQHDINRLLGEA